jgi:hypothetical protein
MNKSQGSHLMVDQNKCAVFGRVLTFHLVLLAALVRHRLPLSLCVMGAQNREFSSVLRIATSPAGSFEASGVSGTANRTFADICLALLQFFHDLCPNFAGAARR